MTDFVHLHVHSEYSLLDGLSKIKKLVPLVKELGMSTLALTDHGNLYGAIEFYKTCQKHNIKPIIGCEMYYTNLKRQDRTLANRHGYHLLLLTKNIIGYRNLMKLISLAHLEGYYYKPKIDWELLEKYHQGLICTSACLEGEVPNLLLNQEYKQAKNKASQFQQLFGDDYYLEIQVHPGLEQQDQANREIVKLSRELAIPLVLTNDSHYLKAEDAFAQDVLLMINTQSTVNDKKRLSMLDIPDFYIKSPEEIIKQAATYPDAITNTIKIAQKCDLTIEIGKWYFPQFKIPTKQDYNRFLQEKTYKAAEEHFGKLSSLILDRLDYELEIICSKGYAPYFLIMEDFIQWCNDNDTITNTRGSAAGSLVSFVLGITPVDPLIYQLPFERFLNRDRPSPPDIDLDVADDKRQKMLYHIINQYGADQVAQICTFGRMMAKGSVRDTARVLGYPYIVGDKISKLIPFGSQGFPMSIDRALDTSSDFKNLYNSDPDSKKIIDTAKKIEGVARHISVHACGLVISPTVITDFTPTQLEPGGNKIITQYEWHAVEDVGLIKFDLLGIRNLSILGASIINVRKTKGIQVNLRKIPLEDKKTFEMLSAGHTMGTFQLGGEGMTKWLKELKPSRVEDLMAMVALYRPGPMAIIPEYIERKNNPKLIKYPDPRMEKLLEKSYGLLVYQDDCLYTAIHLAGYNWVEADQFRKAIGKKIPEEMAKQKEKFIKGCIKNGLTKSKAEKLFSLIEPFVGYGFNKAHAASYGMLAYRTAYMKANYPVEYMCALLTADVNDSEKISAGIEECRKMGIIVSPPDINLSQSGFEIEKNDRSLEGMAILFGLEAIKNVGQAAIENILTERNSNGPFTNFYDFCLRCDNQKVNKRVLESLIKVGAMDRFGQRNAILASLDKIRLECQKINGKQSSGQFGLFDSGDKKNQVMIDKFENMPDLTNNEKLNLEKELLGIYVSENPVSRLLIDFQDLQFEKISSIRDKDQGSFIKTVGVVSKVKDINTRKDNARMAFVTLEDESGRLEIVVFPKLYQKVSGILIENQVIYLEGKTNQRDKDISIIADLITSTPPQKYHNHFDFIIKIPPKTNQSKLMILNQLLKNNPNGHKGLIILPNKKEIPLNYGVNYTQKLKKEINSLLQIQDN